MKFIYFFLKIIVRVALRIFYQKRIVFNKELLQLRQPTILISNHPNTMTDPLFVASLPQKQVFFLGNAGLFNNAFTYWFFSTFYVIPIMRPGDKSYKDINNNDSFQKCFDHLAKGGSIYIAPEGGSFVGRQVRPFKTGTARIALEAEKTHNFGLNTQILPVGLVYEYPAKFGSRVILNVGKPILMKAYEQQYLSDPVDTVKQLTHQLEETVKALTLPHSTEEEGLFNHQYASLLRSEGVSEKDIFQTLKSINNTTTENNKRHLYAKVAKYFSKLHQANISDKALYQNKKGLGSHFIKYFIGIILGFPFFLWGAINNLFVYVLPYLAAKYIKIYPGYIATIKILTGLIVVPVFYTLQYQLVKHYFGNPAALYYLIFLLPAGLFAWKYAAFTKKGHLFLNTFGLSDNKKNELWELRKTIKEDDSQ